MSADEAVPSRAAHETGYIRGDDSWTRWRNTFSLLFGRMNDEGKAQYRKARDDRFEEADCQRCDKYKEHLLTHSPIIRFMREKINDFGGDINSDNVRCARCYKMQSGGFDPNYGIQICANTLKDRKHMEDTLAHEMIHAYDHLRFKVDWEESLRHAACTEIRASTLSGECRWMRNFWGRSQRKLVGQHQECVRMRATLSVMARPSCTGEDHAARVVNDVWEDCYRDTRPFDEIYR